MSEWMTRDEACEYLRVSRTTFDVYRHKGLVKDYYPQGKPKARTGRRVVRFLKSEVEAMMQRREDV